MTDDLWAVVLLDEAPETLRRAAEVAAAIRGVTQADALHRINTSVGFVVERAPLGLAASLKTALARAAVPAEAVPQSRIVVPPDAQTIDRAVVTGPEFQYGGPEVTQVAAWDGILWIDLLELHETGVERRWVYHPGSRGSSGVVEAVEREVEERPLALELTLARPLQRVRFRNDSFAFAATGVKMQPNRRQNMLALAVAIGARATLAELGPGMAGLRDGRLPKPERIDDPARYVRLLRWRLTRLRCEE